MSIVLAEGEGLGGGFDCFESVVIGLLSVDHGMEGFEAIVVVRSAELVRLAGARAVHFRELD